MQHKAVCLLFCRFTVHASGVNHTQHQEYTKLLTTDSDTGHIFCAPETCRVNLQNNEQTALCCISLDNY